MISGNKVVTPKHLGGHKYKTHVDSGALNKIIELFDIKSIIDIGCGPGGMLPISKSLGLRTVGVDGDPWVLKADSSIILHDFTIGKLQLNSNFDLAWSVEFLEHVEEKYQANYMDLFNKCKYALITGAPPGKHGYHHVNCKDSTYWINVFRKYNFEFDSLSTEEIKKSSNMQREFIRNNGLFFKKVN